MKLSIFVSILFVSVLGQTQVLGEVQLLPVPEYQPPVGLFRDANKKISSKNTTSQTEVDQMAVALKDQYQKILQSGSRQPTSCSDPSAVDYIRRLQILGQLQQCGEYAQSCAQESTLNSPMLILIGAICESTYYQYAKAEKLFAAASGARFASSTDYDEVIYQYASFKMTSSHEQEVAAVLKLNPKWGAEQAQWESLIRRVNEINLKGVKKSDVDQFLNAQLNNSGLSSSFLQLLHALKIQILTRDYNFPAAMQELRSQYKFFTNPLLWDYQAYTTLYMALDQDFTWSRKIYDVYDQFAHAWQKFPLEQNTYNYSEIYNQACKSNLLEGTALKQWQQIKKQLQDGSIPLADALVQTQNLLQTNPDKADLLSTWGSLLYMDGKMDQAMQAFWRAHQSCRYYNRANWGLMLVKRYYKYIALPDYQDNLKKIDQETKGLVVPAELNKYILNMGTLSFEIQKRIIYGARIWMPYIQSLHSQGFRTYIKYAFELLSESPHLSEMKDQRIGGANYPNDNRLWDDVRGVGGENVVADLAEVFQTVHGDYNLLGHEMAHQFQSLMEKTYPAGVSCIEKLYQRATLDKNFPDGYSAYNKEEHFAQGVTYWLIPQDAPARFGLNKSWVQQFNPQQFDFINSIDEAHGDFSKLRCAL